jgi:secretion-regulating guanine nucleotide exchange factor
VIGNTKHFKGAAHQVISHNGAEFLLMHFTSSILKIASGQNHVTLLNEHNEVFGIGSNKYNQCLKVTPSEKVIKIVSGWTHNAILTAANELFLYGRNNYGQLGNGTREECRSVFKCPIRPVNAIEAGAEHTIIQSNNEIYTFGWNEHGNCGNGGFDDL